MDIRNIAIIAHVDHGKTTLVDQLLHQCGAFRANEAHAERAMDSNDQERERGITILAKCTSVHVASGDTASTSSTRPATPTSAARWSASSAWSTACVLLVDAAEGPMPQTKFVLAQGAGAGPAPDRRAQQGRPPQRRSRPGVLNEIFDLFAALGATDEQLDFPLLYASGKRGLGGRQASTDPHKDLAPLFDLIVAHMPAPKPSRRDEPFAHARRSCSTPTRSSAACSPAASSPGASSRARPSKSLARDGTEIERGRITKLLAFRGLKRMPVESAEAGDIVAIAGLSRPPSPTPSAPWSRRGRCRPSRSIRRPSP